ncbi:MAG: hypothetical protein ACXIUQ_16140 [Cecembia sp.]
MKNWEWRVMIEEGKGGPTVKKSALWLPLIAIGVVRACPESRAIREARV